MEQIVNKEYAPLFDLKARYIIIMGGRGGGRSTVASQYALAMLTAIDYFRCAIMRFVLGDIRNSIYREIVDRADEVGVKNNLEIADNSMTIKYGLNSINAVGFKKSSGDRTSKLKSLANYNCVIIEEADEVGEAEFMQLDDTLRTIKGDITIILLLNPPPRSHWIIERWFDLLPSEYNDFFIPKLKESQTDTIFIQTNYKDNALNLSEQTIKLYESYKDSKPEHYYNTVLGLVPEVVKGKIFSGWKEIDSVPHEARFEGYGIDFGYSVDPTVIVGVYYYNGGYILDEVAHQKELSNKQIADIILNQPRKGVSIADSAEPKSIDEIKNYGVSIQPAEKGKDSVNYGIQVVQAQQISFTNRSSKLKKDYEIYHWKIDKDGETLNEPDHLGSDAMDAIRYKFCSLIPVIVRQDMIAQMPTYEVEEKGNPAR